VHGHTGPARFALIEQPNVLLLAFRLGDGIRWASQPWQAQRQVAADPPGLPGDDDESAAHLRIHIYLVDNATGIVRAYGQVSWPPFVAAVRATIGRHLTGPQDDAAAGAELDALYQRGPRSPTWSATGRTPPASAARSRVMRMVNVPMRVVLGLPVATPLGRRLMLVTIVGRKTGKVYRQPLSYVRQGTTLLTPGGGKWKLNLRDDQPVPIRLRGHDILPRSELVKDLDEIERLLTVMAAANRSVNAFVGIPKGPDGRLDRTRLQTAVRYGFRIVRWHLDEPPVSSNSPGQRSETR